MIQHKIQNSKHVFTQNIGQSVYKTKEMKL